MLTASLLFAFGAPDNLSQRLRNHIEYLTSEELAGRKAGTPEGYLAGDYVREHFSRLGLLTFERADYFHNFATTWERWLRTKLTEDTDTCTHVNITGEAGSSPA